MVKKTNPPRDKNFPRYGEIWLLKNNPRLKEIGKDYRPLLIISDDERNEYDDSVVSLPLTTDLEDILPVEVFINSTPETGLDRPSKIVCDSPFTWNKKLRLEKKLGVAKPEIMAKVKMAWEIAFKWKGCKIV